ncbi:MAG: phosphatase PAP2 family protein [Ignavibacteria bacterium]|nr:phosphatase PAP2 family protein [Ignavibacteria bacterium]
MPATVVSQESGDQHEETLLGTLGEDGGIILSDAAAYFSAPFRFTGGDWLTAAGAAGGTVLLMTVDDEMKGLLGSENTGSLNGDFWDIPTRYGLVGPANILSVVLYSSGLALDSRDVRVTGRLLFESLTLSGISVMAIRYIFGRSRPYDNNSPWDFNWFETANEVQSFPSGHTTVAFAMSTVFAERIGGVWARVGFYGLASMTAYARVRNNQHWVSDVVAGAGLGLLAGFHVVQRERMREQGELSGGLEIYPTLQGLQVVYRF